MNQNKTMNKIELLADELIDLHPHLAMDVLGYTTKLGRILGWHYLLDLLWILRELDCPPGGTILDAGAGNGMMQFILASKGYRVISADVKHRNIPPFAKNVYSVEQWHSEVDLEHAYLDHHQFSGKQSPATGAEPGDKSDNNPSKLPEIVYYHSNLNRLQRLEDNSIDAVVSVSALEHNSPDELATILDELQRVLKDDASMYITVSAAKQSYFHEPSFSWVMDEADLTRYFQLGQEVESNFHRFDEIFSALCQSQRLSQWLTGIYYRGGKNGMPWGKWDPQYQPVGIVKVNSKK